MRRLLSFLIFATIPFLALSAVMTAGMMFGMAFLVDFTIENCTEQIIVVTPVGTVGAEGHKMPLPVVRDTYPYLPASQIGAWRLAPGEHVKVTYDMDDINFSEIVVEVEGRTFQLVTNPRPTLIQYVGPSQSRYIIDDLSKLQPVDPAVQEAALEASQPDRLAFFLLGLIIAPWIVLGGLLWASRAPRCRIVAP